uniref:Uncharacterized protein n=1 Tax=Nelumbo nucifera TaxID=4432 RepID=A0A822Z3E8_NELNU|nr:TPA_asm: hypothetical protein HUJ06_008636 [Nelumbo nucifera]
MIGYTNLTSSGIYFTSTPTK